MQASDATPTWQPNFVETDNFVQLRADMIRGARSLPRGEKRNQQRQIARYIKTQIESRIGEPKRLLMMFGIYTFRSRSEPRWRVRCATVVRWRPRRSRALRGRARRRMPVLSTGRN
jgi:hypothetical protein